MATVKKLAELKRGRNVELQSVTIAGEIGRCKTSAAYFLKDPQGYGPRIFCPR